MSRPLPLRSALVRGALVSLGNWPAILIDFAVESLYKMALIVPIVGGALMVTVLVGGSVRSIFAEGARTAAARIVAALFGAPVALTSFVVALALVGAGGAILMYVLKGGTLAVLIAGERKAPEGQHGARYRTMTRAYAFDLQTLLAGIRQFSGRMRTLSLVLSGVYAVLGAGYFLTLVAAFRWSDRPGMGSIGPLTVVVATAVAIVLVALLNVAFDVLRVIVVCDDCGLRAAASRLATFLVQDARQVLGIFAVVTGLFALAAAASLLVAAGLALVAWVPIVGIVVVPLQLAAWLIRGVLFQWMALTALCSYQAQYRRFVDGDGSRSVENSL
jgi:hypothetical protein